MDQGQEPCASRLRARDAHRLEQTHHFKITVTTARPVAVAVAPAGASICRFEPVTVARDRYLLCRLPNLAKNAPELLFERGKSFDQFGGIELARNRAGTRDTVNWVIRKMSLKGSLIQHRDAPLPTKSSAQN